YKTYMEDREKRGEQAGDNLLPMEMDALDALGHYWQLIPVDDHRTPGEDTKADAKFAEWLRDSSTWVPLKTLLKARPESLVAAGYPEGAVKAFLDAYRAVEQGEDREPGHLAEPVAEGLLKTSRSLGDAVCSRYPAVAEIERETQFNAINPFWLAP